MSRRRVLKPEEEALWRKVAETAKPLRDTPPRPFAQGVAPKPTKPATSSWTAPQPVRPKTETAVPPSLAMDRKTFGRMTRGKLSPEARIDLHGMTVAAAHPALTGFILRAQAEGRRLILVITGKGKRSEDSGPIPVRPGVLRHQVPHWLDTPPLCQAVLQVTPAHRRHGGDGAFYVYLRRRRE